MGSIRLQIVSRTGASLFEEGLDEVTFRRREDRAEGGSLISILPFHGSMLAQNAAGEISWRRGDVVKRARVGAGVVEVLDDQVVVLVPDVKRVTRGEAR